MAEDLVRAMTQMLVGNAGLSGACDKRTDGGISGRRKSAFFFLSNLPPAMADSANTTDPTFKLIDRHAELWAAAGKLPNDRKHDDERTGILDDASNVFDELLATSPTTARGHAAKWIYAYREGRERQGFDGETLAFYNLRDDEDTMKAVFASLLALSDFVTPTLSGKLGYAALEELSGPAPMLG